ncbi:hypothetical protein EDB84DRAFT_470458 [Lactarius hengduanensis]|nr:hypothetical protein EDB84DRAFT_470458 [Lactarius hengduanensis]
MLLFGRQTMSISASTSQSWLPLRQYYMFSLAQPSNNEAVDGLPVVQLSDDAGLVRALITALYPIPFEIPASYDRILALLAAAQKYDMGTVFSSIRSEVGRRKLSTLKGTQVFRAYAIASNSMLIPEMEMAARLSLGLSMTFEDLGVELRLFEGGALRALVPSCQRHSKPHHCPSPAPLDVAVTIIRSYLNWLSFLCSWSHTDSHWPSLHQSLNLDARKPC